VCRQVSSLKLDGTALNGTADRVAGKTLAVAIGNSAWVTPVELMQRDLAQLGPAAAVVIGLPVGSLVAVVVHRRLALVPLLLSVGLGSAWYLAYEREWSNPGVGGAAVALLAVLAGWVCLGVAIIREDRFKV
jgi:hypothetical protein